MGATGGPHHLAPTELFFQVTHFVEEEAEGRKRRVFFAANGVVFFFGDLYIHILLLAKVVFFFFVLVILFFLHLISSLLGISYQGFSFFRSEKKSQNPRLPGGRLLC